MHDLIALLPRSWQRDLEHFQFETVDSGMSGARLLRLRGPSSQQLYVKIAAADGLADFRGEVERTRWLFGRGIRVPDLRRVFDDGRSGIVLMTALPGVHPQDARRPVAQVVRHLARALRALHDMPLDDCPFDETVAARLTRAREMIAQGEITGEHFAHRNRGRSPQSIYEQLAASVPPVQDLVLVHGDAKFDNMLIDDAGGVGFIDCGHAGRGDRYLDLEAVTGDIEEHFGAQWIEPFAREYGVKLDRPKLMFFSDLYELF